MLNLDANTPRARAMARAILPLVIERERYEASLIDFVEGSWSSFDPSTYQPNWAIDALCEHLQAVTEGQIKRLLINYPPRCSKTNVASVCFPAWTWARAERSYLSGPQVRFLCGSYNDELSLQNSTKHRRLLNSPFYQRYWGQRVAILRDQNTKTQFDTSAGGSRISTSARGSLLGLGGDVILIDDPHNTKTAESEAERLQSLTWWREISTTRLNDPKNAAIVVIMQRLHEEDVSGIILSSDWSSEWVHLCIPMSYEWRRHCVTVLGWEDPRGLDEDDEPLITIAANGARLPRDAKVERELDDSREGMLMWPERFGPTEIARITSELGPYMSSGRLQQAPVPAKGGIFDRSWWKEWDPPDGKYPPFDHVIASVDSAFTDKEQNDPTGFTVWGIWTPDAKQVTWHDQQEGLHTSWLGGDRTRVMLIAAWRKHLQFSGPRIERGANETWKAYKQRTQDQWGLIEWIDDSFHLYKVHRVLIEAKASGISAAQELRNRFKFNPASIIAMPVKGDKTARALAVQPMLAGGYIYAPLHLTWAQMVVDEMAMFPLGRYKDLTDSTTQAWKWMRDTHLSPTDEEEDQAALEGVTHKSRIKPLYPV